MVTARYRGVRRAMMARTQATARQLAMNAAMGTGRSELQTRSLDTQSPALRHTASPFCYCLCASAVASHCLLRCSLSS